MQSMSELMFLLINEEDYHLICSNCMVLMTVTSQW